jgi:hypothetical protein
MRLFNFNRIEAISLLCGFLLGAACSVKFTDDVHYTCTKDADCAGDGFVCTAKTGGAGSCCKSTGPEICADGKDNDCNGKIDAQDVWPDEICNGTDDNCDGNIDEGFDLRIDIVNCGACKTKCGTNQYCSSGTCRSQLEADCSDGIDNDMNTFTDCADPSCTEAPCSTGCRCRAAKKTEVNCNDNLDNDADAKADCADSDCGGAGCGDGGCVCDALRRRETACNDTTDNDGDGASDCGDSDCVGQTCQATGTFRCAGNACKCNGAVVVTETSAVLCRDQIDNDCDGLTDCQEADCTGLSCNPDGGLGCLCAAGKRAETQCGDRKDNDSDGNTDCADVADCPAGTVCTYLNSTGVIVNGSCAATKLCQ